MNRLRWRRCLVMAVLIAGLAILIGALCLHRTEISSARLVAQVKSPPISFDLSNADAREQWLRYPSSLALFGKESLSETCQPISWRESYRIVYGRSWGPNDLVEVTIGNGRGTILALRARIPSPPPEPKLNSRRGSAIEQMTLSGQSKPELLRQASIDKEQISAIRFQADRLFAEHTPTTNGSVGSDGNGFTVEICRNERYAFFHRWAPALKDIRNTEAVNFANLLLTLAGQEQFNN